MTETITLKINGRTETVAVAPHLTLLETLRDRLNLSGTKEGCSTGHCGACTVLLDGQPVSSCLLLAVEVGERAVTTVEGLAADGELHSLQRAFIEDGALQCGFCTSGMLLAALALLEENPRPADTEIRMALVGNLCRCTGYRKIVKAVQHAAEKINHE